MNVEAQAPHHLLPPAPGAKAAKVCGILSIPFALTCIGFPVALVLAIVALVQQAKAKSLVQAHPETYAPVPATGLVTGIIGLVLPVVMLPFVGIVSAIAIPAMLGQREAAKARTVEAMVHQAATAVTQEALNQPQADGGVDPQAVVQAVLARPDFSRLPGARNIYTPTEGAFVAAEAPDRDGQVALKGGFTSGEDGRKHPAVQVWGQVRKAGRAELVKQVVTLD